MQGLVSGLLIVSVGVKTQEELKVISPHLDPEIPLKSEIKLDENHISRVVLFLRHSGIRTGCLLWHHSAKQ